LHVPKPKAFVTRAIPEHGLALVREHCDADIWPGDMPPSRAELLQHLAQAEGIISLLTDRMDAEAMDAAPRLRVISNMAVGVDNVDLAAATARRIPVGNTPGAMTDATADLTFALMMAAARRLLEGERYVRDGKWKTWSPQLLLGADFAGATWGIIGFGRIGQAVARRAQGFDLRVIYHDSSAQPAFGATPVSLSQLLAEADFISLHVPLVDPDALYEALRSNRIFAAGLDVTEPEPLPADHPLLNLANCIIVPHLGSASRRTRDRMARMAAENLIAGLNGERLPYCANVEVYG
jgi:glyoxylate reductase